MLIYDNRPYRIIGIDPSTTAMGVAVVDMGEVTRKRKVVHTTTYRRSHGKNVMPWLKNIYDERTVCIYGFCSLIRDEFEKWQPDGVAIERAHLREFPEAYKALSEIIKAITHEAIRWDNTMPIINVEASVVKSNIGVSGKSGDKSLVSDMILSDKLELDTSNIDVHTATEHEYDAVAIALFGLDRIVP